MQPASPTSALLSLWMARAGRAAASQRRPVCGIAVTPNGRMCISIARVLLLPHYSEGNTHLELVAMRMRYAAVWKLLTVKVKSIFAPILSSLIKCIELFNDIRVYVVEWDSSGTCFDT